MKTNRIKILIIFLILLLVALITFFALRYHNEDRTKRFVEESLISEEQNAERNLSKSFLERLESETFVNQEYYLENVRDFSLERTVESIEITTDYSATAIVNNITTNRRTGFTIKTTETYEIILIRENNELRIDSFNLLESKTIE